jgi:hypothetical protein
MTHATFDNLLRIDGYTGYLLLLLKVYLTQESYGFLFFGWLQHDSEMTI